MNDGSLEFVAESRCREPFDLRAPARIGSAGVVAFATDRERRVLWWKQLPDIRRVRPSLMPYTADEGVDRQNQRLHADGVRVGFALFNIEIPGERGISRLWVYEATRREGNLSPVLLGNVAVPAP